MFTCKTLEELRQAAEGAGVRLPLSDGTDVLHRPLAVAGRVLSNRIAIQPMEG